jgi:hypothetical protein
MGETYSTHERDEKFIQDFRILLSDETTWETLASMRTILKYIISSELRGAYKALGSEGKNLIRLTKDSFQWQALMNPEVNLGVPQKMRNLLYR